MAKIVKDDDTPDQIRPDVEAGDQEAGTYDRGAEGDVQGAPRSGPAADGAASGVRRGAESAPPDRDEGEDSPIQEGMSRTGTGHYMGRQAAEDGKDKEISSSNG